MIISAILHGPLVLMLVGAPTLRQSVVLPRLSAPESGVTLISPRSLAIGDADRFYVADQDPARILSFDSSGVLLRIVGREGGGPGEFRTPVLGAGSFLVVNDAREKRLTAFDHDGRLLWTKPGTCCRSRPIRVDNKGNIYVVSSPVIIGGGMSLDEMIVFSPAGVPLDTIAVPGFGQQAGSGKHEWRLVTKQAALAATIPFTPETHFTITRTGTVVWGHSASYTLMEGPDASTPRRTVRRQWSSSPLSSAERSRGREANIVSFTRFVDRPQLEEAFRLADVPLRAPAFFGLDIDACGRWWVLRSSSYMSASPTFDVLSNEGEFITTVSLPNRLVKDALWRVGRSRLVAIVEDADGEPTLGIYGLSGFPACN